jgi:hypothetical protein
LIVQLVRELVLVLQQELGLELQLVLVLEQELGLELQLALVLVQELQQVLALAQHLPHQPLQSPFQRQRFHLLQHEFLSTLQQLAKALRCQLCRLKLRTMARRQQSCRQLF